MTNAYGLKDSGTFALNEDINLYWYISYYGTSYNTQAHYALVIQNNQRSIRVSHDLSEYNGAEIIYLFDVKRRSKKQLQKAIDIGQEKLKTLKDSDYAVKNLIKQIAFWKSEGKKLLNKTIDDYLYSLDIKEKAKFYDKLMTGKLFVIDDFTNENSCIVYSLSANMQHFKEEYKNQHPELDVGFSDLNLFIDSEKDVDNFIKFVQTQNNADNFLISNNPDQLN